MKVEIIPIEQAKAQARASRISPEQEAQITDMLQNLTKDDGAKIITDEGESMGSLKSRIQKIAKAEGVSEYQNRQKEGYGDRVEGGWEIKKGRLMRPSRFPTIDDDLARKICQDLGIP